MSLVPPRRRVSSRLACKASPPLLTLPELPLFSLASHLELETIAALALAMGSTGAALLIAAADVIEGELLRRNHLPLTDEQDATTPAFELDEFGRDSYGIGQPTTDRRSHLQHDARARLLRADTAVLDAGVDRESIYVHGESFGAWAGITWETSVLLSLPDQRRDTAGARVLFLMSAAFENGEYGGPCLQQDEAGSYFNVIDVLLPGDGKFQTMIAFETNAWDGWGSTCDGLGCHTCDASTASALAAACGVDETGVGQVLRAMMHCAFGDAWDSLQGNYLGQLNYRIEQEREDIDDDDDGDDDDGWRHGEVRAINDATRLFPNITDNFSQRWKPNYAHEERLARATGEEAVANKVEADALRAAVISDEAGCTAEVLAAFHAQWTGGIGFNSITLDEEQAPRRRTMKLCEALPSRSSLASTIACLHGWSDACTYEQKPRRYDHECPRCSCAFEDAHDECPRCKEGPTEYMG